MSFNFPMILTHQFQTTLDTKVKKIANLSNFMKETCENQGLKKLFTHVSYSKQQECFCRREIVKPYNS